MRRILFAVPLLLLAIPFLILDDLSRTYLGEALLVLGIIQLVNSYRFGLSITERSGNVVRIYHTIIDRKNLEYFAQVVNSQQYSYQDVRGDHEDKESLTYQPLALQTKQWTTSTDSPAGDTTSKMPTS